MGRLNSLQDYAEGSEGVRQQCDYSAIQLLQLKNGRCENSIEMALKLKAGKPQEQALKTSACDWYGRGGRCLGKKGVMSARYRGGRTAGTGETSGGATG
jgi:hypothetical protein